MLFAIFVLLAVTIYLNEIGLPAFLKKPLLKELHDRGIDVEFSRLRVRWYRGLVAEDVHVGSAKPQVSVPQLSVATAEVNLNHAALAKFHLKVDGLVLHDGRMVWPVNESNQPPKQLTANKIETRLRLLPDDQWELDQFSADVGGARLQLSGSLTNASALRNWKIFRGTRGTPPEDVRRRLRRLSDTLDELKFATPPKVAIVLHGDALKMGSFNGLLTVDAPSADTPWGALTNGALAVHLISATSRDREPQTEFKLRAGEAVTRWGSATNLQVHLHAVTDEAITNRIRGRLELLADGLTTRWAEGTNAQFTAEWTHSFTNPIPQDGTINLKVAGAHTRWGTAAQLQLDANLSCPTNYIPPQVDPSRDWWTNPIPVAGTARLRATNASTRWGDVGEVDLDVHVSTPATNHILQADKQWAWWAYLEPYALDWTCTAKRADSLELKDMRCSGTWRTPALAITNLDAGIYGGHLDAQASLDVVTRALIFHAVTDFDVQKASPFLTEGARRWFSEQQFEWKTPPLAHASGGVTLPAWTNSHPDWRHEVQPTFWLDGEFKVGRASFRQVPVSFAQSHFNYTNMAWRLPDLHVLRPEGKIDMAIHTDDRSKDFHYQIHSTIDVKALKPVLDEKARRGLDTFIFTMPPQMDGEVWGRFRDNSKLGVHAYVVLTNFTFRGQSATHFHGSVQFTNGILKLTNGRVERGINEYGTASLVLVDFARHQLYLTNGFSTLEPTAIVDAIGPKVAKTVEPYHFSRPPTGYVEGVIPLVNEAVADLHFKIDGGPFHWMKFNVDHISGNVDWMGKHLDLSRVRASFYQGALTGNAVFNFKPDDGADFSFDTIITDCNIRPLVTDLFVRTNKLEGHLSGHLSITHGNTLDRLSWFGRGQADLTDGLIWEIPIFGVFSQVLNGIHSGLGESRANQGSATFVITNSVLHSDDLEIRSPLLRMKYRGIIGFDGTVDAVVEARLLRDFWVVGPIISAVLTPITKLFEYKVTGTVGHPKTEALIPKVLFGSPKTTAPNPAPEAPNPPPTLFQKKPPP